MERGGEGFGARVRRVLLAFDGWFDSFVFERGRGLARTYAAFSAFMERFAVHGWHRWTVELACEALTLGLGAAVVALVLAIPAFRDTSEDWLKKQDLAVTFLDRTGAEVGRRGILHDDSVPVAQMPPYLVQAVLATEDRRFFDHYGIDPIGTARALTVNAGSSGVVQGGSTLTQQLAKNLFLSNERTLGRKIKEAYLALWLEHHLSKREILQTYLDRVYMGGGTFGIQAASEFYFGKSVRDVTLPEAAMLAGLFKAPSKYAPHINLPAARARAGDVLSNLVDAGYMTEGQVYPARRNPATPRRPHARGRARLVPRLRLRRSAQARPRRQPGVEPRADRPHRARQRHPGAERIRHRGPAPREGAELPRQAERHGADGARRGRAGHRGRARLRRQPVQPRHGGAAPARIVLQALRLPGGAGDGQVQADHAGDGFPRLHRHLLRAQLRRRADGDAAALGRRWPTRSTPSPSSCRSPSATAHPAPAAPRSSPSPTRSASPRRWRTQCRCPSARGT